MSFLSSIKLSITQWLLASLAACVGILVVMLDMKGSALHRAQVQLLEAHMDTRQSAIDASVAAAKQNYLKVRSSYLDASPEGHTEERK
jgi:uncharacterized membrane-anchored protein YhcB (DUF1043 family)